MHGIVEWAQDRVASRSEMPCRAYSGRPRPLRRALTGLGLALVVATPGACRGPAPEPPPPASASAEPPAAPRAEPGLPPRDLAGQPLYSQHKEELIARDFFEDRGHGFFLDVGCASPVRHNNTYFLEKHLGWSGIAVDALPDYRQAWERKRPRSKFFNYLVSDRADTVEAFYRVVEHKTVSTVREETTRGPGGRPVTLEELRVPTITLTALLERNGVSKIDFLSMDIEGFEPVALAGFDLARFRPELACIEAKPENRAKIRDYFAARGYRQIERYLDYDQVNYYFTPR